MRRGRRIEHPSFTGRGRVRRLRRGAGQLEARQWIGGQQTPAGRPVIGGPDDAHAAAGRAFTHAAFALQVQKGRHVFHTDAMGLALAVNVRKQPKMVRAGGPGGRIAQAVQITIQNFGYRGARRATLGSPPPYGLDDGPLPLIERCLGLLKGQSVRLLGKGPLAGPAAPRLTVFDHPGLTFVLQAHNRHDNLLLCALSVKTLCDCQRTVGLV